MPFLLVLPVKSYPPSFRPRLHATSSQKSIFYLYLQACHQWFCEKPPPSPHWRFCRERLWQLSSSTEPFPPQGSRRRGLTRPTGPTPKHLQIKLRAHHTGIQDPLEPLSMQHFLKVCGKFVLKKPYTGRLCARKRTTKQRLAVSRRCPRRIFPISHAREWETQEPINYFTIRNPCCRD